MLFVIWSSVVKAEGGGWWRLGNTLSIVMWDNKTAILFNEHQVKSKVDNMAGINSAVEISDSQLKSTFSFFLFGHSGQHAELPMASELEVQSLNHWTTKEVSEEEFLTEK